LTTTHVEQPPPVPNDRPSAHDGVVADIVARKALGLERYGSLLQSFNGRDAARDAYEEVLDLAAYLRQLREELAVVQPVVVAAVEWHRAPASSAHAIPLTRAVEDLLAAGWREAAA
jgi:hypothetical protein